MCTRGWLRAAALILVLAFYILLRGADEFGPSDSEWYAAHRRTGSPTFSKRSLRSASALAAETVNKPLVSRGRQVKAAKAPAQFTYWLPPDALATGVLQKGSASRLAAKLAALKAGRPTKFLAVGASITGGGGTLPTQSDGPGWPQWLESYLTWRFNGTASLHIAAVGGTTTQYWSLCYKRHLPITDPDVVILEFAVNNLNSYHTNDVYDNRNSRSFERLVRHFLQLPSRPAVITLNAVSWRVERMPGIYWAVSAEPAIQQISAYYDLPVLSVRGCCYHRMASNVTGFRIDIAGRDVARPEWEAMKGTMWFWDTTHPNAWTGHRGMADLVAGLVDDVMAGVDTGANSSQAVPEAELPKPMIPNNHAGSGNKCLADDDLRDAAVSVSGFDWVDESRHSGIHKWGYVGHEPASSIVLEVDTRPALHAREGGAPAAGAAEGVQVQLGYLKSYEHMGTARVECVKGCECEPTEIDGHHMEHHSQVFFHDFLATWHEKCHVQVTVLNKTSSGDTKVKLMGLVVSEDVGASEAWELPRRMP